MELLTQRDLYGVYLAFAYISTAQCTVDIGSVHEESRKSGTGEVGGWMGVTIIIIMKVRIIIIMKVRIIIIMKVRIDVKVKLQFQVPGDSHSIIKYLIDV